MAIVSFEDIIAWQKARLLSIEVYKNFKDCKDYAFRDQIQRASVSVMNNIAEGYERNGNKEFRSFSFIAKGSCGEVRSMLNLATELGYVPSDKANQLTDDATLISRLLSGLIKTL